MLGPASTWARGLLSVRSPQTHGCGQQQHLGCGCMATGTEQGPDGETGRVCASLEHPVCPAPATHAPALARVALSVLDLSIVSPSVCCNKEGRMIQNIGRLCTE